MRPKDAPINVNLYTNTVLDGTSVCDSVILSVRYRNHFPVVQFQNQAHIWNPRGTGHVFKTFFLSPPKAAWADAPSGTPLAPQIWGAHGAPIFFLFLRRPQRWRRRVFREYILGYLPNFKKFGSYL